MAITHSAPQKATATGGFFAVDSRIWLKVCQFGMNEAIAYLVLARGTGRDNRTTTWSVESIERYTGISRHRAAAAVKNLQAREFTRLLRDGTKPKYELIPYADPMQMVRQELSQLEHYVVDLIARREEINGPREKQAAYRAAAKGWLATEGTGRLAVGSQPKTEADWIWLPNELVTGALEEVPPLELVRQTQDPMTLKLFIDRVKVGEHAQFIVWGFYDGSEWVNWENSLTSPHRREKLTKEEITAGKNAAVDFFRRTAQLTDLGLIESVPHLVESADQSGEIIHPLRMGLSDSIEDRLGRAAHEAGRALLTEGQCGWTVKNGIQQLVPVPRHIANVQMIGIARLRYRPRTKMTSAWWADLNANAQKHLARYAEIAARQNTRIVA